jgi:hypothetical protein
MWKTSVPRFEVWAYLNPSSTDEERIRNLLIQTIGLPAKYVVRRMHLTVYHARRRLPDLEALTEDASVLLPAQDIRFMVRAPGGENPRPELDPSANKVGVRVHKQSSAGPLIQSYRARLLAYETPTVLGDRKPSTARTSAFGARHFQPHMTLLRSGSGIERDLTMIGEEFRRSFDVFKFDMFTIKLVDRRS